MDLLTRSGRLAGKAALLALALTLNGCYYVKSAYRQMSLLSQRVPFEKALERPDLSDEEKRKIRLAQEVMIFAEEKLGLKSGGNYTSFVALDRPYVTYVVSAAPKWELRHHTWDFPIIGKAPYKGYFDERDAKAEEESLRKKDLDTFLRGVSAYSTLGWFRDPLLSSMLRYKDHDLVNTLIHETVHATLFIKNNADFNERLATFMGNWGTDLFYKSKEGTDSETVRRIHDENRDEKLFAEFISKELRLLESWYREQTEKDEEIRKKRIREIQDRFVTELKPRLKSRQYERFPELELNNARLLVYRTYLQDLSDFEKLAEKLGGDFGKFLEAVKSLEKNPDPAAGLKDLVGQD